MVWQIYISFKNNLVSLSINEINHCSQQLGRAHYGVKQFHQVKMSKFTQNLVKPKVNWDAFPSSDTMMYMYYEITKDYILEC